MNSEQDVEPAIQLPFARVLIVAAMLLITACAGNGEGLDANGRPLLPGVSGGVPLTADFDSIQANIFTPICSVCHAGGSAPQGLRLDAANSYNLLVGVPSTEVPSLLRVNPGDPVNSYIIQKLQGHAAVGGQMPLGGPYLTPDVIAFVQQWITNGAPAPSAAAAFEPFAITAELPDAAEAVSEPPPQVLIAFNHDLDVARIDIASARIEKLAANSPQSVIQVIAARVALPSVNLKALMIWPDQALTPGRYRLILLAATPLLFTDTAGESLAVGTQQNMDEFVVATFDVAVSP